MPNAFSKEFRPSPDLSRLKWTPESARHPIGVRRRELRPASSNGDTVPLRNRSSARSSLR